MERGIKRSRKKFNILSVLLVCFLLLVNVLETPAIFATSANEVVTENTHEPTNEIGTNTENNSQEDLQQGAEVIDEIPHFDVPIMPLNGGMTIVPASGEIDESLVVQFVGQAEVIETGKVGTMRLSVRLSGTNSGDHAKVRIEMPENTVGYELPQFINNKYTIPDTTDVIELVTIGGKQYLEFEVRNGQTMLGYIQFRVPSGTTPDGYELKFEDSSITYVTADSQFSGTPEFKASSLKYSATNRWAAMSGNISSPSGNNTITTGTTTPRLSNDHVYSRTFTNSHSGQTTGVVFTKEYTYTETITLPTGISFPTGAITYSADRRYVYIGGVTILYSAQPIESATVSGNQLTFVHRRVNDTINADGTPVNGKTPTDLPTLSGYSTQLYARSLNVDVSQINSNVSITTSSQFEAVSGLNNPATGQPYKWTSTSTTTKAITRPVPTPSLSKTVSKATIEDLSESFTYTIRVSNSGAKPMTGKITDTLNANLEFVSASAGHTKTGNTITWDNVTLNQGETKTYTITVKFLTTVSDGITVTNRADYSDGSYSTYGTASNRYVKPKEEITTFSLAYLGSYNVFANDNAGYRLTVANNGSEDAYNKEITLQIPEGLVLSVEQVAAIRTRVNTAQYGNASVSYDAGANKITISGLTIPKKTTLTIDFYGRVTGLLNTGMQMRNNTLLTVVASMSGRPNTTAAHYFKQAKIDMLVSKKGEDPRYISPGVYEIDYRISAKYQDDLDTDKLTDGIKFIDVMQNGLHPKGATGQEAIGTTGTMTGIDSNGDTVTGTWRVISRVGAEVANRYEITWPQLPSMQKDDVYYIDYVGEVILRKRPNGEYITDDVRNSVEAMQFDLGSLEFTFIIGGSTTSTGTNNDKIAGLTVSKRAVEQNGIAIGSNQQEINLQEGDWITYQITARNTKNATEDGASAITATITDTLPKPGISGFQWILYDGTNGDVANVYIVDQPAEDASKVTLVGNDLSWIGVTLNPDTDTGKHGDGTNGTHDSASPICTEHGKPGHTNCTQKEFKVLLRYPVGAVFYSTFGGAGDEFHNKVKAESPTLNLEAESGVNHIVKLSDPTLEKTVDRFEVDSCDESVADRTVVFTIGGFGINRFVPDVSLIDDLSNVRDYLTISAINFGEFEITRRGQDEKKYTIELGFLENGNMNYVPVEVADDGVGVFPTGHQIKDLVTVNWHFGDVASLKIIKEPTITAVSTVRNAGIAKNEAFLYYSIAVESASASVKITDTASLSKKAYKNNGQLLSEGDLVAEGDNIEFRINFNNTSGDEIQLDQIAITDYINTLGMDTSRNITNLEVRHYALGNAEADDPAVLAATVIPSATWSTGEFAIPFTSGTLKPGDNLIISYSVRVGSRITRSLDQSLTEAQRKQYAVYNEVKAVIGLNEIEARTEYFYPEPTAVVYMQNALYGVGYGVKGTGSYSYDATSTNVHFRSAIFNHQSEMFGNSLTQLTSVPTYRNNSTRSSDLTQQYYLFYEVTVVNSESSSVEIQVDSIEKSLDFEGVIVGYYTATNNGSTNSTTPYFASSETVTRMQVRDLEAAGMSSGVTYGNYSTNNLSSSKTSPSIQGAGNVTFKSISGTIYQNSSTLSMAASYKKLKPGEAMSFTVIVRLPATADMSKAMNNTITAKISADNNIDWVLADDIEVNVPTINNTASKPLTANKGTTVRNGNTLTSTVTINPPTYELQVSKRTIGFYKNSGWSSYTSPGTLRPIELESPNVDDYLAFEILVRNPNDYPISGYKIEDQLPYPYEVAAVYVQNSGDSGYSGYFRWNGTSTSYNCTKSTLTSGLSQNAPDQIITLNGNGNDFFVNNSYKSNSVIPANGTLTVTIVAKVRDGAIADYRTYDNHVELTMSNGAKVTAIKGGTSVVEASTLVGTKDFSAVSLAGSFGAGAESTVTNSDADSTTGNSEVKFVPVDANGTFRYTLSLQSKSVYDFENLVIIDRMPAVGDVGIINASSVRESEFAVGFASTPNVVVKLVAENGTTTIVDPSNYKVQYKQHGASETFNSSLDFADGGGTDWKNAPEANSSALRVIFINNWKMPARTNLLVEFDAVVKDASNVSVEDTAWNSFGYSYSVTDSQGTVFMRAESAKVGARITGAKIAVFKTDNSGTPIPLSGAVFSVYADSQCTGSPVNACSGAEVATLTTGLNGRAVTTNNLPRGVYYVKEKTAPVGYILSNTIYEVDLSAAEYDSVHYVTGNENIAVINQLKPLTLGIKKVMNTANKGADMITGDVTIFVNGDFLESDGTITSETKSVSFNATERANGTEKNITGLITNRSYTVSESSNDYTASYSIPAATGTVNSSTGVFSISENTTLTVTNTEPACGKLILKKTVVGYDAEETFTIQVTGIFADSGSSSVTRDFTIAHAQRSSGVEVPNLIYGNTYTVNEKADSVASNYDVSGEQSNVRILTNDQTITITNTRKEVGELRIKKVLKNTINSDTFDIDITGIFMDSLGVEDTRRVTLSHNGESVISNVIYGEEYKIEEINPAAKYEATIAGKDEDETTVGSYSSNIYTMTMAGKDVVVTVTNAVDIPVSLKVKKEVVGYDGDETFTLEVTGIFDDSVSGSETREFTILPSQRAAGIVIPDLVFENTYAITEKADAASANYTLTGAGNVTMVDMNHEMTLTNTRKTAGVLTVKKTVVGYGGNDTFTVEVTGIFSNSSSGSETREFAITEGQRATGVTIANVVYGNTYVISEKADTVSENYTATYDRTSVTMGATAEEVMVTNTRKGADLTIKKTVVGYGGTDSFVMEVTGIFEDSVGYASETREYTMLSSERATGIAIPKLIQGIGYTVAEKADTVSANYTVSYDKTSVTTSSVAQEVMVTNTRKSAGVLTVKKVVDGITTTQAFAFKVTGNFSDNTTEKLFNLEHNETRQISEVVYGESYVVEEVTVDALYNVSVEGKDSSNSAVGTASGQELEYTAGSKAVTVTITNQYEAEGTITLGAKKVIEGANAVKEAEYAGEFTFNLYEIKSGSRVFVSSAVNALDGTVQFDAIVYVHNKDGDGNSDIGTHIYEIEEVNDGAIADMRYSSKVYQIEVEVTDNRNGTLQAEAEMDGVVYDPSDVEFVNEMTLDFDLYLYPKGLIEIPLPDGVFELYRDDVEEENLIAMESQENNWFQMFSAKIVTEYRTDWAGMIHYSGLKVGHYVLLQKSAPKNHLIMQKRVEFDIVADPITGELKLSIAGTEEFVTLTGDTQLNIPNEYRPPVSVTIPFTGK